MKKEQTSKKHESLPQEVAVVYEGCVRAIEEAKQWFKLNYKKDNKQKQSK